MKRSLLANSTNMKLAVLGDIHSNNIAFEACIEDINKSNVYGICLIGDYISDCPNPQETIALINELKKNYKVWMVMGNREEYFINHQDGKDSGWNYSSYEGSLLYTYEKLTSLNIDNLRKLPLTSSVNIPSTDPLLLVHGSQRHIKELLYEDKENTKECLDDMDEVYLLSGHTHKRTYYKYNDKVLVNPGSVGVAIGEKATAHYCILEWKGSKWEVDFRSIPYDIEKLRKIFYKSSLMDKGGVWPNCIIKSIEEGVNWGPICSKRAYDYAVAEGVELSDRNVPDKYWRKAAIDLDIV